MSRLPPNPPPREPSQPSDPGATPDSSAGEPPHDALDSLLRKWHDAPESSLDAGRSRLLEALSREPLSAPGLDHQPAESPITHAPESRSAAPSPGRRWWTRRPIHALGALAALALVASLALIIARPPAPAHPSILTGSAAAKDESLSSKVMERGLASSPPPAGVSVASADAALHDSVAVLPALSEKQVARAQQVLSPTLQKIALTQTQNAVVLFTPTPPGNSADRERKESDRSAATESADKKADRADADQRSKSYGAGQQASASQNARARRPLPLAITVEKFDAPTQNLLELNGFTNLRQLGKSNIIQGVAFEDSLLPLATLEVVSRIEELPAASAATPPPTATPATAAPAAPVAKPADKPADASGEKQPKKK